MPAIAMSKEMQFLFIQTLTRAQTIASAQSDKAILSLLTSRISAAKYPRRRKK